MDFTAYLCIVEIPWLVMVIVFLASTIFATFGFGDALLALPFLTFLIGLKQATPLLAISGFTLAIGLMGTNFKHINWKEAIRLVIGSIIGVPIGVWLLKNIDTTLMEILVGIIIALIAIYNLLKPDLFKITTYRTAPLFGFVGGALGGAFNTSGPPAVMYGAMRGWTPHVFVGTIQAYFIPTDITVISMHRASGLLNDTVFTYYLWCFPFLILAIIIGNLLKKRLPVEKFKNGVFVLIFISGLMLIIKNIIHL
ncbi:MAG: sulfite exporter TauE/SafE family protein [Chitinophagales bacterium]|nr:sulfite exporter TauE/SafE family protein [Chitinophagales bacterium]